MSRFACTLAECPPGLFLFGDCLGFKSEYRSDTGKVEAFVVDSGEYFWGGAKTSEEREALMVHPVELVDACSLRFVPLEPEEQ